MIPAVTWYREWFGEDYLELYAHRDEREAARHVDFVLQQFGSSAPEGGPSAPEGHVLDLACGAGRHTQELRRRGVKALGVDLSLTLLAVPPHHPRGRADMRSLPFAEDSFSWVLNFFTSFGYFEHERENFRVLEEIHRVLAPGGRFLIDFLNSERAIANLQPRDQDQLEDGRRLEIQRWYDAQTRRINKRITIHPGSGHPGPGSPRTYLESVRAYSENEVTCGLRWSGLEVDERFGGFDAQPFSHDSERLILVGHRPR
ncbi:MAG: class I SAM-dependent methyltransferase [Acidobacteriota bacterium]